SVLDAAAPTSRYSCGTSCGKISERLSEQARSAPIPPGAPSRSFMIGLDFQEVKCLFLTKWSRRLVLAGPIGNGQSCLWPLRSKDLPVIGDPDGNRRLRIRRVYFRE